MKIILIRPSYSDVYGLMKREVEDKQIYAPLGLMYIASSLEQDGHNVEIVDGEVDALSLTEIARFIANKNPDVVGVGGTTPEFYASEEICKVAKQFNPEIVTVVGGAHATAMPEEVLQNENIDFVIRGEAEETFRDLLNRIDDPHRVRGIYWRPKWTGDGRKVEFTGEREFLDFEKLPPPARHLVDNSKYRACSVESGMKVTVSVQTTRGCFGNCSYCASHNTFGRKIRFRSAKSVVDEIEHCRNTYNSEYITFIDDTFTCSEKHVREICEEMIKRKIGLKWFCMGRADTIAGRRSMLELMHKAGCEKISVGVESGNQEQLDRIHKNITIRQCRETFATMKAIGFETDASFIIGLPFDTEETIEDTIKLALELDIDRANFNIMTPYPATEVYNMALRDEGIHFVDKNFKNFRRWGCAVTRTDTVSAERLIELQKQATQRFWLRPQILQHHLQMLQKENKSRYYHRPLREAFDLMWSQLE